LKNEGGGKGGRKRGLVGTKAADKRDQVIAQRGGKGRRKPRSRVANLGETEVSMPRLIPATGKKKGSPGGSGEGRGRGAW